MPAQARRLRWLLAVLAGTVAATLLASLAAASPDQRPVTNWLRRHAVPVSSVDPDVPVDDLEPLGRSIGAAQIVGLGEAVHGASELVTLRHRTLRYLVEELGFRSIAWEEQWTTGVLVDDYIVTGAGDVDALAEQLSSQWQSQEVKAVLQWLRSYNVSHPDDPVRFVGVDYYMTWLPAYDAVEGYVERAAPHRLAELDAHMKQIRPKAKPGYGPEEHVAWYMNELTDRSEYISAARAVHSLVEDVAAEVPEGADVALHNARQILWFHEHYDLAEGDQPVVRDARAAQNLEWWQRRHPDDRIVYWAASAHTANAPDLRIVAAWGEFRFPTTGSHLRARYGDTYVSVGFTFDAGAVAADAGPVTLPPAEDHWFERQLRDVPHEQFIVDLHAESPSPVQEWLDAPIATRGLPDAGPGAYMDGGTLRAWFDVLVHRQRVTPVRPLTP